VALRKNKETISQFSQLLVFALDFTKMKSHISKEFLQIYNNSDTATSSTNTRLFQLESRNAAPPVSKPCFNPPHYYHLSFLGEVSKTHQFCYSIWDTFARIPHYFSDEREKDLWISSSFRTATGLLGNQFPSYPWWRSLLTRNASHQDLTTKLALMMAPFVLPELLHSDTFLATIEDHISSHTHYKKKSGNCYLLTCSILHPSLNGN
jgi:hypothetical protein